MGDIQPGPCQICGLTNYLLSMGGPTICPACDCGNTGPIVIKRQRDEITRLRAEVERLDVEKITLAEETHAAEAERDRLREALEKENQDARRLSGCLIAIHEAGDDVPSSVLQSIAYDGALNCMDAETAAFQIKRRAALAAPEEEEEREDMGPSGNRRVDRKTDGVAFRRKSQPSGPTNIKCPAEKAGKQCACQDAGMTTQQATCDFVFD